MSKIATKPKTFSVQDSYEEYTKKLISKNPFLVGKRKYSIANGEVTYSIDNKLYIDYKKYKRVIASFCIKAAIRLLNGYTIDLLNGLGYLYICRIGRNPNNPKLNKGESYKLKKELTAAGTVTDDNWKVFYTDDEYIRLKWSKTSYIRNLLFYTFTPAGGQVGKGFRQQMSRAITANPSFKALYPFIPYKPSPSHNGSI